MNVKGIIVTIFIIILIYIIIQYIFGKSSTLSSVSSATTMQTIQASSLQQNSQTSATNFTYSIWFYVDDWNYKYGETKVIYGRMGNVGSVDSLTESAISSADPCPAVVLGAVENNLTILMTVYPGESSGNSMVHPCIVSNIPIQKWTNLLISTYGRTLDVYLDGKLVKTSVLPGIAQVNSSENVYITPAGGFAGWTSKFQYFPNSTDPQTAWNIYKAGYGNSMLSSIFGQYQVEVVFSQNGTETSSFTI
jgi:hypothetical protein